MHHLSDRLGIAIIVLVPLEESFDVLSGDQAHIMAEHLELTADVVSAGTGLHANQARWDIGQPLRELGPGELEARPCCTDRLANALTHPRPLV